MVCAFLGVANLRTLYGVTLILRSRACRIGEGGQAALAVSRKKNDEGTDTGKLGFLPLVELHLLLTLHLRIIIVYFGELIDQGLDRRTMKFSAVEANGKKMEQELCTESG